MAGLTAAGLEIKSSAEVRTDLEDAFKAPSGYGPGTSVLPSGPLGKIIGIISTSIGLVWSLVQQVYDSFDPDQAEGEQLDNLVGLTGITRLQPTKTAGSIDLTGTPGTVIPLGSIVRIGTNGEQFLTTAEFTIGGGGSVTATVEAENAGAIEATAGSIDTIVTVIAGWTGITHGTDLVTGRDLETDSELRVRRESSLQIIGAATDGAIQSRLQALTEAGVLQAIVVSNRDDPTEADGIPLHAFESIIWPATADQTLIAETIFLTMPSGIQPFGSSVTAEVTVSPGITTTVRFTFATELSTHVVVNLTTTSAYPANGDDQVTEAVERAIEGGTDADGNTIVGLNVGEDLILARIFCEVFKVDGISTIEILAKVGSTPTGSDNVNLTATFREIFTTQASQITVNS